MPFWDVDFSGAIGSGWDSGGEDAEDEQFLFAGALNEASAVDKQIMGPC